MALRVGVDIGGTFTDFVMIDEGSGDVYLHKQLTTPDDPAAAVLEGIQYICSSNNILIKNISTIVHGTTLVTNAAIERKGCELGMLVTKGFADFPESGRECRYDLFDLKIAFPEPLVARSKRIEVDERLSDDGRILKPLDLGEVERSVDKLLSTTHVEAFAVCLLHSYFKPDHEQQIRDLLQRMVPDIYVSISSEGYPTARELERWTTTLLNAYVQPLVDGYLTDLSKGLSGIGFRGSLFIMSSSGGSLTPDVARRFPVRLLESGPAAGVLMAAEHGRRLGADKLLSFDMGGTTAKGSLVLDHQTLKAYELEAARVHHFKKGSGLLVKTPVIDLIEIGSGGGSLAEVDERGMIRVGPVSAGAKPGPVCYGQGGTKPTLTDANLVLGYLDADYFLGGTMKIDRAAAGRAIEEHIAAPLGIDLIRAAWGIHEVANEDVARSFRLHASERGTDYRSASMVAFGGSGPAHAIRIARKLKMSRLVFPPGAGVMSAFGMLVSPLSFEVIRSHRVVLGALSSESQREFFASLEKEATDVLLEAGIPREDMHISRRLDMRYEGQGYEIEIPLDSLGESDLSASKIADLFVSEYSRIFSRPVPDRGLEIINWKLTATGKEPLKLTRENLKRYAGGSGMKKRVRTAYDPDAGEMVPFNIYDRYSLRPGDQLDGPSIVEEKEATCVIGGNANVYVDEFLNLVAEF